MRKFLALILINLSLILQSCTDKAQQEFELVIKDHKFYPEVLDVPADTKIVLIVHNQDDTIEEFESFDLKREKIILAGQKIKVILAPLRIGEYKFFGEFHEDTAQGKLIVK